VIRIGASSAPVIVIETGAFSHSIVFAPSITVLQLEPVFVSTAARRCRFRD